MSTLTVAVDIHATALFFVDINQTALFQPVGGQRSSTSIDIHFTALFITPVFKLVQEPPY